MKLKNKKALITGASRNIGASIAVKLASEGADVCLHFHSDETGVQKIKAEVESMGREALLVQADFSKRDQVNALFGEANNWAGGIDILVNNAGDYDTSSILDLDLSRFQSLLDVGVLTTTQLTQLAAKAMIARGVAGSIINISSISGFRAYPNRTAHASTKAALNMMTQSAALELGEHNIRVNAVCPGAVPYQNDAGYITDSIPLGRPGKPTDIANAVLFLVSEDASWVTGHMLVVDGGHSLSLKG